MHGFTPKDDVFSFFLERKKKNPVLVDDIIPYIENPKQSTRNVLELIHQVIKTAVYKINTQKSAVFPYTRNERSEKEIRKIIPWKIAVKE